MLKVGFATSSSGSVISAPGLRRCHPGAKVTAGTLFLLLFFFFPLQKLIFCESFFTSRSSWSSHMEGRTWLHPHRLATAVPMLHCLKVTRYLCFLWAVFFFFFLHETLNRSISLFSSLFSPQQQQQQKNSLSLTPLLLWIDLADCRLLHYTLTLINSDLLAEWGFHQDRSWINNKDFFFFKGCLISLPSRLSCQRPTQKNTKARLTEKLFICQINENKWEVNWMKVRI